MVAAVDYKKKLDECMQSTFTVVAQASVRKGLVDECYKKFKKCKVNLASENTGYSFDQARLSLRLNEIDTQKNAHAAIGALALVGGFAAGYFLGRS